MTIVTGKAGSGKTVEMVKQCAKQNLVAVVEFNDYKQVLNDLAQNLGCRGLVVVTYREFIDLFYGQGRGHAKTGRYFIDDIRRFFECAYGAGTVEGFVCDGEDLVITAKDPAVGFYKKDLFQA